MKKLFAVLSVVLVMFAVACKKADVVATPSNDSIAVDSAKADSVAVDSVEIDSVK